MQIDLSCSDGEPIPIKLFVISFNLKFKLVVLSRFWFNGNDSFDALVGIKILFISDPIIQIDAEFKITYKNDEKIEKMSKSLYGFAYLKTLLYVLFII